MTGSDPATAATQQLVQRLATEGALPVGWEVLDWDVDQGPSVTLVAGDDILRAELSARSELEPCLVRTERFNLNARDPFFEGRSLGPGARAAFDALAAFAAASGTGYRAALSGVARRRSVYNRSLGSWKS